MLAKIQRETILNGIMQAIVRVHRAIAINAMLQQCRFCLTLFLSRCFVLVVQRVKICM